MSYSAHNKKHASKEVLNSGNFIYKEKRGTFTKWKSEMIHKKKEMKKWIIKTHCSEENLTSILYDSLILELWYKRNVINKETTSLKNNISYLSHGIKIIHRSQLHQ